MSQHYATHSKGALTPRKKKPRSHRNTAQNVATKPRASPQGLATWVATASRCAISYATRWRDSTSQDLATRKCVGINLPLCPFLLRREIALPRRRLARHVASPCVLARGSVTMSCVVLQRGCGLPLRSVYAPLRQE